MGVAKRTSGEKVIRGGLFIWEETRVENGRDEGRWGGKYKNGKMEKRGDRRGRSYASRLPVSTLV